VSDHLTQGYEELLQLQTDTFLELGCLGAFHKNSIYGQTPARHVVLHNVMFVPLNLEGKTVGIMGLANKQNDFNQEDAEIASVFGDLAAIALENSRYIELLTEKTNALEKAMSELKTLRGIIPICMHCKGIRDDQGDWNQLEAYISEHSDAHFSHGLCDKCLEKYYPDEGD